MSLAGREEDTYVGGRRLSTDVRGQGENWRRDLASDRRPWKFSPATSPFPCREGVAGNASMEMSLVSLVHRADGKEKLAAILSSDSTIGQKLLFR